MRKNRDQILFLGLLVFLFGCHSVANNEISEVELFLEQDEKNGHNIVLTDLEPITKQFDRQEIKEALALKKANQEALIVHLYIPLCDNEHQGIVPTSKSLGDGLSVRTNLYWATSGGTKAYFKKQADWELLYDSLNIDSNVLERVVFKKNIDRIPVFLIADAYRGDRMEETLNNYLSAIAGAHTDSVLLDNGTTLVGAGNADMVMFNGHNGMMDAVRLNNYPNKDGRKKDVVMNACVSYGYLQEEFMKAGGYPLVRTNTLLYPGAYVLAQIIEDWVKGVEEKQLCLNAGRAYCLKHDCGAGSKVYKAGW